MGLIAASQLDTSAPEWLVQDMIPLNGIGFAHGPRSAGKSQVFSTELALAVANGTGFFGHPVEQGNVVVCLGEGLYDAGIRKQARIERQAADGGPQPYDDSHLLIYTEAFPVPLIKSPYLRNVGQAGFEQALAIFKQIPGLQLLILDALQDFAGGESITSEGPAVRYVDGLKRMERELDCLILVIAHNLKNQPVMRGSQRFQDAANFVLQVEPEAALPGEPPNGTLFGTKQKYGPGFEPVGFQMVTGEMEADVLDDDGEPSGETKTIPVSTVRSYDPNAIPVMPAAGRTRRRRTGIRLLRRDEPEEETA